MLVININGIVQGVGFRPFVYKLASDLNLKGYVRNSSQGVEIKLTGTENNLQIFINHLQNDLPPAAKIESLIINIMPDCSFFSFLIIESIHNSGITDISPDLATCSKCATELAQKTDQRFNYPFINCTNCGPRYSIIESTPYDREFTSMKNFEMCDYCHSEYIDPLNRRFHAQPVACPDCGPQLILLDSQFQQIKGDPVDFTRKLLTKGNIIGIKGIGGFHLACLATDEGAVRKLRSRKRRPDKPFAVMCRAENLSQVVYYREKDMELLRSPAAPIVILPSKEQIISSLVSPSLPTLGVILPYAPVHYLLLQDDIKFLIMTSGNNNDEPVAASEKELQNICDYFLTHDREILNRSDDSVIRSSEPENILIRRSRGYVPSPLKVKEELADSFAAGASMKLTFALAKKDSIYLSPYISNSDTIRSLAFYQETYEKYKKWFKINPQFAACDLQADFMSTRFAENLDIPLIRVQHHHAHIAAVMAEHNINEPVIGVAYDGTGSGYDGAIWGGEIMIADYQTCQRRLHLQYMPLPGGDSATKNPIRIAFAWLTQAHLDTDFLTEISPLEKKIITKQLASDLNVFYTSSLGRFFDCVTAMLGMFPSVSFDAQAAMALEFLCSGIDPMHCDPYNYYIEKDIIMISPILKEIIADIHNKIDHKIIAARFHRTIIDITLASVKIIHKETGINIVVLAGGVMQNAVILSNLLSLLQKNNFTVLTAGCIPPNDGSIAVGQIMIANHQNI